MDRKTRLELARLILERDSPTAKNTVDVMGIRKTGSGLEISEEHSW